MLKRQAPGKKMVEGRDGVPRWRNVEMAQDRDSLVQMAKPRGNRVGHRGRGSGGIDGARERGCDGWDLLVQLSGPSWMK